MPAARRKPSKITVLLSDDEFERFDSFCRDRGFKKSTLIARLIRQFLEMESYGYGAPPRPPVSRPGR